MTPDEPTAPTSSNKIDDARVSAEAATGFGDDHVEVVVEDLFIEEYEMPLTLPPEPPGQKGRRVLGRLRSHPKSLLGGVLALGGLVMATVLATSRRKTSALSRLFLKLGIAR